MANKNGFDTYETWQAGDPLMVLRRTVPRENPTWRAGIFECLDGEGVCATHASGVSGYWSDKMSLKRDKPVHHPNEVRLPTDEEFAQIAQWWSVEDRNHFLAKLQRMKLSEPDEVKKIIEPFSTWVYHDVCMVSMNSSAKNPSWTVGHFCVMNDQELALVADTCKKPNERGMIAPMVLMFEQKNVRLMTNMEFDAYVDGRSLEEIEQLRDQRTRMSESVDIPVQEAYEYYVFGNWDQIEKIPELLIYNWNSTTNDEAAPSFVKNRVAVGFTIKEAAANVYKEMKNRGLVAFKNWLD